MHALLGSAAVTSAFGNALGYSIAEGSGQTAGNVGASEQAEKALQARENARDAAMWDLVGGDTSIPSQSYFDNRILAMNGGNAPNDTGGLRVYGMPRQPEPVAESIFYSDDLNADSQRVYNGAGDEITAQDREIEAFMRKQSAKVRSDDLINGKIAEAKMMANAQAAQKATVHNQMVAGQLSGGSSVISGDSLSSRSVIEASPQTSLASLWSSLRSTSDYVWADWNSAPRGFKIGQTVDAANTFVGGVKDLGLSWLAEKAVDSRSPMLQWAAVGTIAVIDTVAPANLTELAPVGKLGKLGRVGEELTGRLIGDAERAASSAEKVSGRSWKVFGDNEIFTQRVEWTATRPQGTGQTYQLIQRNDIDWAVSRTDGPADFIGKTNAEAAAKGFAPQLSDGNFATLHHVGQDSRGALAEASTRYHGIGKPGQNALHSLYGKNTPHPAYPIDRGAFNVDTREYWKWRVENQ